MTVRSYAHGHVGAIAPRNPGALALSASDLHNLLKEKSAAAAAPGERGVCMRRAGGGWYRWPALWAQAALPGLALAVLVLSPAAHSAARLAARLAVGAVTSPSCPATATAAARTAPGPSGGSSWTPAGRTTGTRTATWPSWWWGSPGGPACSAGPAASGWAPAGRLAPSCT